MMCKWMYKDSFKNLTDMPTAAITEKHLSMRQISATKKPPAGQKASAKWLLLGSGLALWLGTLAPAHADVWGYVDEAGNTHFAQRQLDARYQLYFKTDTSPAWQQGGHDAGGGSNSSPASATAAVPIVGRSALAFNPQADAAAGAKAQRLVALINQSAAYRQVSALLQREATRHALDVELVKAIVAAESGFNARAVSPAGALGLMQVMPDTARMLGLQGDAKQTVEQKLTDPETNVRLGTRYLRQLLAQFRGRADLAVAAYNAGPGAVRRRMAVPPYTETQNYVRTVLAIYQTLQPSATHTSNNATHGAARSGGKRMRVTLAGSRSTLPPPVPSSSATASDSPTALDTIASKITLADHIVAPELDQDVRILPAPAQVPAPAASMPATAPPPASAPVSSQKQ